MNKKLLFRRKALHFLLKFMEIEERDNFKEYVSSVQTRIYLTKGPKAAWIWFWGQFARSLPRLFKKSIDGSIIMIQNYLKTACRSILKHKGYSLLNILGLTGGTLCCLLISLYVHNELNYDSYHKDADRVYRVGLIWKFPTGQNPWTTIAQPAVETIKGYSQEVETIARLTNYATQLVRLDDKLFYEPYCLAADPEIFHILSIPGIAGNLETALLRPNTVVLAERMARKYFGRSDPRGRQIRIGSRDFEITGIAADPPNNTHCKYNFIFSIPPAQAQRKKDWGSLSYITYLKLKDNVNPTAFEEKIKHMADEEYEYLKESGGSHIYFLQPLKNIHLYSNLRRELEPSGNPKDLSILMVVGVFILVITILNFVSLATAVSSTRLKEVGVRQILGAKRIQLIMQFVGENSAIIILSLFGAYLLSGLLIPFFNTLSASMFKRTDLFQPEILMVFPILALILILGAGLYPALVLSSSGPEITIKGKQKGGNRPAAIRGILVIGQFAVSTAMIICTIIIGQQVRFMRSQYLGFEKEQKLVIRVRGGASINQSFETVKAAFQAHSSISGACVSSNVPGRPCNITGMKLQGSEFVYRFNYYNVDHDFIPLYGIRVLAGSPFSREKTTDLQAILINEAGLKKFGLGSPEEAVGKRVARGDFSGFNFEIIGVIQDIHITGLQSVVEPFFLKTDPAYYYITLKIGTSGLEEILAATEKKWKEFFPHVPFEFFFLDEDFNRQYISENRMASLFRFFTLLGLFTACSGLFSLVTYTVSLRTKEIAIRKVVGASVPVITNLLVRQYLGWVLAANLFGWPAAYVFMSRWLQNFAFRIEVHPMVFMLAGLTALGIAFLTVGFQTIKSASADPVDSLRYE